MRIHARDVVVAYVSAPFYAERLVEARHELGRKQIVGIAKACHASARFDVVGHAGDEKLAVEIRVIPQEDELLFGVYGGVTVLEIKRKIFIPLVQIAPRFVRFLFALIWCGFEKNHRFYWTIRLLLNSAICLAGLNFSVSKKYFCLPYCGSRF